MLSDCNSHLPFWYLENFTANDYGIKSLIWCYRRGLGTACSLPLTKLVSRVEADDIATEAEGTIGKLTARVPVNASERRQFSQFLSMQWLRIYRSHRQKSDITMSEQEPDDREPSTKLLSDAIIKMKWSIRNTERNELITSDSPVILNNPTVSKTLGPPTRLAYEVIFPISSATLFIATWDGHAGHGPMSSGVVQQINQLICRTAETFVYSAIQMPCIAQSLMQPRQRLIQACFPRSNSRD